MAMPALKASFAAAARGIGWPTLSPKSTANRTSFCWCFSGKFVSYSPASIFGPLRPYIGEAIAPSLMTSIMSAPLRPAFWPTAKPSERATMLMPITMLMTSFILAPAPTSPRKNVRLPITSKQGCASSLRAWSPAARITSWPLRAGPFEPLTGASRKRPPLARTALPISNAVSSSTVDMSTNFFPGDMPASTPFSPKTTARAEAGSEVQAKTMSQDSTRACAVSATLAPFSANGLHLSLLRFQTVVGKPASTSRPAIADPMMPMPR
mmetsp:Transcript_23632/g.67784  ORF Transcript_23632/g.67784 Transcript_23632/m.67784 type:complete len:266 (-) Transcript_23632:87-884(-)